MNSLDYPLIPIYFQDFKTSCYVTAKLHTAKYLCARKYTHRILVILHLFQCVSSLLTIFILAHFSEHIKMTHNHLEKDLGVQESLTHMEKIPHTAVAAENGIS